MPETTVRRRSCRVQSLTPERRSSRAFLRVALEQGSPVAGEDEIAASRHLVQEGESRRAEMDRVRLAVLGVLARDDPEPLLEIHMGPGHAPDLVPALPREGEHLHDRAEWKPDRPGRLQDLRQLVVGQHTVPRLLPGRRGNPGAWGHLQNAPSDAPVEELADGGEYPVGHDRRAPFPDPVE